LHSTLTSQLNEQPKQVKYPIWRHCMIAAKNNNVYMQVLDADTKINASLVSYR
jgi:hypothetical protein